MEKVTCSKYALHFLGSFLTIVALSFLGCKEKNTNAPIEQSTTVDSRWISLFDGKSLKGWKRFNADSIGPIWSVEEGAIKCDGKGHGEGSGEYGGSLITIKMFENFELELEWKISEGGNSGIMYHVIEKPEYSHAYATGPEYQIRDDKNAKVQIPDRLTGAHYGIYAASDAKKLNPIMEWNSSKIIYNKGHVENWLNGIKIIEFDENSNDYKERYKKSKWASGKYPDWNTYKKGAIALQDHGAKVWYKNIRIRKL
ncbi:DUF1080 domain-containing protein [Tamlana sp. 2201CG12-4]|uniref:3-keto-disaccharide hydrolase n=1 Tax=Tamlana sp. 2201CG12-4 TaxID=3112582 RepID=UPI002DBD2827|nr:DUF1080 domain-containing protein [Tamlana sp. 2201CG12-4]MEC3905837.1 DUF1080 domain-containing protein [Tamlana sp. 2201CG12-4]